MTDFTLDDSGDLKILGNNLVAADSTLQHQADIIWSEKSWWHFAPALGVGLQQWLNESGTSPGLVRVIRQELERDGMNVETVGIGDDGIKINATYPE